MSTFLQCQVYTLTQLFTRFEVRNMLFRHFHAFAGFRVAPDTGRAVVQVEAADKGDLSENSEYDAAKEAQRHLEARIAELKMTVAQAKIVDVSRLSTDAVQIMSTVEMTNVKTNAKMKYTIVSETEANLKQNKISIKTPIAQGLLNKKVGDEVEITIPRGTITLRIDKISIDA